MIVLRWFLPVCAPVYLFIGQACAQSPGCANESGDPECAAAGNPINVITGNKYQRDVDMAPLPGQMGLEVYPAANLPKK